MRSRKGKDGPVQNASAPEVADLVAQIEAAQAKIRDDEADAAREHVRIGAMLVELQERVGRTWMQTVKQVGYHQRVACRLQKLGSSWWRDEIGPTGSNFFTQLSPDLHKLEWLCRLSREQLTEVLNEVDVMKVSRTAVKEAVQAKLGLAEDRPVQPVSIDRLLRSLERFTARTIEAIEEFGPEAVVDGQLDEFRSALAGCFDELQSSIDLATNLTRTEDDA
jgi:hypothetical protein